VPILLCSYRLEDYDVFCGIECIKDEEGIHGQAPFRTTGRPGVVRVVTTPH
jgi:hypothetical protein